MIRIGVTGASGFIGRWLIEDLSARGYETRAIARRRPDGLPSGVQWVASPNLSADADWGRAVAGLDAIIHSAARVHVMRETHQDPIAAFHQANVEGTMRLARQAAAAGIRRFIFLSSIKVNGESTAAGERYRATDVPQPADPYGLSKLEAEQLLFQLSRETGLEVVVIRPVLVYGPGVKANFEALTRAVARGLPLPFGRVSNARSMVFVGNLSDLAIRALEHPSAPGGVFLVSDGESLSTAELVRRLGLALERKAWLLPIPRLLIRAAAAVLGREALARRLLDSLVVDIDSTCDQLGWTPPYSLEQGLVETAKAFRRARGGSEA